MVELGKNSGGGGGEIRSALNAHKETSPLFSLSAPNERQACKPFISQYFPSGEKSSWDFLQFLHSGSAFLCNKAPMPPRPQLRTFPPLKYLLLSIKTWVSWECPAFQKSVLESRNSHWGQRKQVCSFSHITLQLNIMFPGKIVQRQVFKAICCHRKIMEGHNCCMISSAEAVLLQ